VRRVGRFLSRWWLRVWGFGSAAMNRRTVFRLWREGAVAGCAAALFLWAGLAWGQTVPGAKYVGSKSCEGCHQAAYAGWSKTPMANVVRDPKVHPEAVLADFATPNPLVKFDLGQVAFVYGSRWKQRFFTKVGDDYFVQPAQWDVQKKVWLPFHVEKGADWWVPFYGETNQERPTGPLCDGCHSVNYNIETKQVTEWNVGCEKCHGPGSEHVAHPTKTNIVNPGALPAFAANDTCIQCHSQGQPLANPIEGKYYDWAVGFEPGKRLADYWKLEELKPGVTNFYQFADMSAHKNRMQGNDFVQSNMYHRGIRCSDCHNVHTSDNVASLVAKGNAVCLQCHAAGMNNAAGLRVTVAAHTHHAENSTGSQCVECHMPKIAQTIKDGYVRSHTFRFISPVLTQQSGIPNPCTSCHKDQTNEWALKELKGWGTVSPWRVAGFGTDITAAKPQ
jgi:predicted CXXCH cytochrome family protein